MKVVSAIKAASLLVWLGSILAASLFAGLMIATAGGAVYTPLYRAAAPFACDGEFTVESRRYSYKPGQSGVSHTIYCKDAATGARTDITFYAIFVAFLVYSGLIFAVFAAVSLVLVVPLRAVGRRLKGGGPVNWPRAPVVKWRGPGATSSAPGWTTPPPPPPGASSHAPGASFGAARVVVNGQEYASPEEMPDGVRAAYEQAMGVFADADGDGVPDIFENLAARAPAPGPDAAARLTKLKSLRDAGLITQQEYETKRAQILSEL
jgi:hypothetical protein